MLNRNKLVKFNLYLILLLNTSICLNYASRSGSGSQRIQAGRNKFTFMIKQKAIYLHNNNSTIAPQIFIDLSSKLGYRCSCTDVIGKLSYCFFRATYLQNYQQQNYHPILPTTFFVVGKMGFF